LSLNELKTSQASAYPEILLLDISDALFFFSEFRAYFRFYGSFSEPLILLLS
jgi:hypothetical protein